MRQAVAHIVSVAQYHFASGYADDGDGSASKRPEIDRGEHTLPYNVELWDETKSFVEQVLAVTAHGSIGYAAYYAATREFPTRYVTLRHKGSIVSRWNGPKH